ncbi:unnamed protein product [Arctogadus glacialis]
MIPSKGTVKVVRAAERAIRQHSPGKAPDEVVVAHFVREEIGTEDVFALGSHVQESQFGIDNHLSLLLSLRVDPFKMAAAVAVSRPELNIAVAYLVFYISMLPPPGLP